MMSDGVLPGETPVSLNEARGWLRMGATIDDAVIAGLIRAATSVCEAFIGRRLIVRSEEHTSEIQSLMRISYAVFCLKKKTSTDILTNSQLSYTNHIYRI